MMTDRLNEIENKLARLRDFEREFGKIGDVSSRIDKLLGERDQMLAIKERTCMGHCKDCRHYNKYCVEIGKLVRIPSDEEGALTVDPYFGCVLFEDKNNSNNND